MHPLRILFVILCIALVFFTATQTPEKPPVHSLTGDVNTQQTSLALEPSSSALIAGKESIPPEPSLMRHDYAHLKDFVLPEIHLVNTNAKEAVDSLIEHYQNVCKSTGETALDFKVSIEGEGLGSIDSTLEGSFQHILERIALFSGFELDQDRSHLNLRAIDQKKAVTEKTLEVPANFEYLVGISIDAHECQDHGTQENSINAHLKSLMHLSPDAQISYNPHHSTLKATGTETDLYRLSKLAYLSAQEKVVRVRTSTKMFSVPVDMSVPTNTLLSNEAAELVYENAAKQKEFKQSSPPLIVSMNGERSTIAETQEVVALDETDGSLYHDWKGYRITTSSDLLGFGVQSYVRVETNIPEPDSKKLVFHDKEAEHFLLPNESVIIKTHETEEVAHYLSMSKSIDGSLENRLAGR